MVRLSGLHLGGFKSIKSLPFLRLANVNVFIGANGAGKSNLVAFFRLLRSLASGRLQEFVGRAGGANALLHYGAKQTPVMWGSLEFDHESDLRRYGFSLSSTETDSFVFSNEEVELPEVTDLTAIGSSRLGAGHRESLLASDDVHLTLRRLLAGISTFHFEDTSETAAIRRRGYMEDNRQLREDAGNLAAFLFALRQMHPAYYRRITTTIRQIAPFFGDFELSPLRTDPNSIMLNWTDRDSDYLFGPHQLSDGTLRTMALVTLLAQPESDLPPVIVLDEPEIGLHPVCIGDRSGARQECGGSQHHCTGNPVRRSREPIRPRRRHYGHPGKCRKQV
jgi:predicted ATPase